MSALTPNLENVTTIASDGKRRFLHPADVRGPFTRMRAIVGLLLLGIYAALPWIPINGFPAVFLDVANLRFHFFGLTLVTQDLWLGFFLITGLGFSLFYVTALLGRVWCGWACPQTVFLDFIRRVERWIEGDATARRKLDAESWTSSKLMKRVAKHAFFALFATALAHVLLSYFVSIPGIWNAMRHSPLAHWNLFLLVMAITGGLWFNFAWFREQFCIILCPYGRLQSALIDKNTLVIGYDAQRGEPRGRKSATTGDCVDCGRCVAVCPTGIDIRQGVQIECIGCAACIDACDTVMAKLDRPPGLVRYASTNALAGKKTRWIRPRIILYTCLLLVGASVMTYGLSTLRAARMNVVRVTGTPYVLEHDTIRNQFFIRIINKKHVADAFQVGLANLPPGSHTAGIGEWIAVESLADVVRPVAITIPRSAFHGDFSLRFTVTNTTGTTKLEKSITFIGPVLAEDHDKHEREKKRHENDERHE